MSEYKLVVIQTDGKSNVEDKYNNTSYSYYEGATSAMTEALEEDENICASIIEHFTS